MTTFLTGTRALATGFAEILRTPRSLLLGALPALISSLLLLGALGWLVVSSGELATSLTPFASDWSPPLRAALRTALSVVVVGTGGLLAAVSFIALTLLVGGPFYEAIAERAERCRGLEVGDDGAGWIRSTARGLRDSVVLVLLAVAGAAVLLGLGFVPVLGQTVVPVLGVLFGAWMLSLEMVGLVFQRRGAGVRARHRALRAHRAATFGFGLPTYLLCLIPLAQLIVVPAAVVGGTLLAHRMLDRATAVSRNS